MVRVELYFEEQMKVGTVVGKKDTQDPDVRPSMNSSRDMLNKSRNFMLVNCGKKAASVSFWSVNISKIL